MGTFSLTRRAAYSLLPRPFTNFFSYPRRKERVAFDKVATQVFPPHVSGVHIYNRNRLPPVSESFALDWIPGTLTLSSEYLLAWY